MTVGQIYIDTTTGDLKYQGTSGTPSILTRADGTVHLVPLIVNYSGTTGVQSVGVSTFTGIGVSSFDPSAIFSTNGKVTRTIKYVVVLEGSTGVTAEIQLYNLSAGAIVTGSLLSTSNNSPTLLSGTLTVGASPNVPNSAQLYEVQLRISSPSSPAVSDRAICKMAYIQVTWS
ncbi:MAG TPA: hypothetical protein VM577_18580 [Anaerovoracaceae bacterium]|nr:hypothetical protein [Anaerovoracaceae bacterium]